MKVLGTSGWVDDMLCEREMIGKLNCSTEEYILYQIRIFQFHYYVETNLLIELP